MLPVRFFGNHEREFVAVADDVLRGAPIVKTYTIPPNSRFNVWVNQEVPELTNENFGAVVEVTNSVPIAVERALYWTSSGVAFAGGSNATAIRLP